MGAKVGCEGVRVRMMKLGGVCVILHPPPPRHRHRLSPFQALPPLPSGSGYPIPSRIRFPRPTKALFLSPSLLRLSVAKAMAGWRERRDGSPGNVTLDAFSVVVGPDQIEDANLDREINAASIASQLVLVGRQRPPNRADSRSAEIGWGVLGTRRKGCPSLPALPLFQFWGKGTNPTRTDRGGERTTDCIALFPGWIAQAHAHVRPTRYVT